MVSRHLISGGNMVSRKFSANASYAGGQPSNLKCSLFHNSCFSSGNESHTWCPYSWQRMSRNIGQSSPQSYRTLWLPGRRLSYDAFISICPGSDTAATRKRYSDRSSQINTTFNLSVDTTHEAITSRTACLCSAEPPITSGTACAVAGSSKNRSIEVISKRFIALFYH